MILRGEDGGKGGGTKSGNFKRLFKLLSGVFVALSYAHNLLVQQFEGDGIEIAFGIKVTQPLA